MLTAHLGAAALKRGPVLTPCHGPIDTRHGLVKCWREKGHHGRSSQNCRAARRPRRRGRRCRRCPGGRGGASCTRRDAAVRELRRRCRGRLEPIWRQLGCCHRRLARVPPVGHERGRQGARRLHDVDRLRGAGAGQADRLQRLGPARRSGGAGAEYDQLLRAGPHQHRPSGDHQTGKWVAGHARRRRRLGRHWQLVHAAARGVGQHADRLPQRHTGRVGHRRRVRRRPGRAGHLLRERVVRRRPRRDGQRRATEQPAADLAAPARRRLRRPARRRPGPAGSWASPPASPR